MTNLLKALLLVSGKTIAISLLMEKGLFRRDVDGIKGKTLVNKATSILVEKNIVVKETFTMGNQSQVNFKFLNIVSY